MKRILKIGLPIAPVAFVILSVAVWPGCVPVRTPVYGYEIVAQYPHDADAFTQGLAIADGALYESTGLRGQSSLRRVDLETGNVLQRANLEPPYFAEGLAVVDDRIIQLTWQEHTAFVYDRDDFTPQGTFTYLGEGWGLAYDGTRLIMSDGSARLSFLDPENFSVIGGVDVSDDKGPVRLLNELEFIGGEIYANVWTSDRIARIAPDTGRVTGWINLRGLLPNEARTPTTDVLNGIAYDAQADRLFVTGKRWPLLYEIRLVPPD